MARRRKVPIKLGEKRIVGSGESMRIERTLFCGECGRRLKTATIQKPHTNIARVCDNVEGHKFGEVWMWPLENVKIPKF